MEYKAKTIKHDENKNFYQRELFEYKLKHWFESMDIEDLSDYLEIYTDGKGVIEYAMETYADRLFDYMEENKEILQKVNGRDNREEDLFSLKIGIFDYAGICLDYEVREVFEDKISISNGNELWLLENGDFVVIHCIGYEGTNGKAEYRYLDHKLSDFGEAGVDVERFLSSLETFL